MALTKIGYSMPVARRQAGQALCAGAFALLAVTNHSASAQAMPLAAPLAHASVCATPSAPRVSTGCQFAEYDLSFVLPAQLKWQTAHNSEHFYAVLLRSVKAIHVDASNPNDDTQCGGYVSEQHRVAVQAMFAQHKVFASRHGCSLVWYNNVNSSYNFLAVFAGKSYAQAKSMLQ
jgi:hypothetical protein